jgi:hypothetical protein
VCDHREGNYAALHSIHTRCTAAAVAAAATAAAAVPADSLNSNSSSSSTTDISSAAADDDADFDQPDVFNVADTLKVRAPLHTAYTASCTVATFVTLLLE